MRYVALLEFPTKGIAAEVYVAEDAVVEAVVEDDEQLGILMINN